MSDFDALFILTCGVMLPTIVSLAVSVRRLNVDVSLLTRTVFLITKRLP